MNKYTVLDKDLYGYILDILSNPDKVGEAEYLAVVRFNEWFTTNKYWFNNDKVNQIFYVIRQIKHFEDPFTGLPFELIPWLKFVVANIFGWYKSDDHTKRVIKNVLMLISRKAGKGLDLETDIPTPTGFRKFKDVHVGDYIFDANGNPTKVLFETDVQHRDCYKLTFETGDEIITDDVHRWTVKDINSRVPDLLTVKTTEEMYKKGTYRVRRDGKGVEYRFRIPKQAPVQYPEKDLPMDPYVLGQWLGDGDSKGNRIALDLRDIEMYEHASKIYGPYTFRKDPRNKYGADLIFNNSWSRGENNKKMTKLTHDLIKTGVFKNKHIPEIYKYGSIEQRLSLIQGLMDTDGSISKGKYPMVEFTQKRKDLVLDVKEILASLGITSRLNKEEGKINGKVVGEYWTLSFYVDKRMNIFRLKRKSDRVPEKLNKRMNYITIKSIEKIDTVPTKCIAVDNPDKLFLAGKGYLATHNSSLSAAIAIAAIIADGIQGGEAFLVSNTRDQAKILYKYVRGFIKSIDPKNKYFRTFRDNLTYVKNNYTLKVLASEAMHNDGYNPSLFILDEFHAALDYDLYSVMKSGQAMRKNPLGIIISSAGSLLSGYPLYESVKVAYDVLRGLKTDDSSFYAIYQMKETDDWKDERNWRKASPNYKITVSEDYMRERITEAENDVSKESDVKTKNLNIWCNAVSAWITLDIVVNSMYHVDLNDFLGETAYMGIDLSETNDLTAVSVLLPPNPSRDKWPDKYVFKSVAYIPGIAMKRSKNRTIYLGFLNKGEAKLTSGETVDYNEVVSDIKSVCSKLNVEKIGFDKFNAINLVRMCEEEGFPMEAYSLTLLNFNIPSKAFFELIMNGMVVIDKSTVTTFCFNNVELRYDKNRNIKPSLPEDDRNKKIDIVISMLEALGIYLSENLYYYGE